MSILFHVSLGSPHPIYRQIVDQVSRAVATGKLRPNETLPSIRALAERLVVNPNTVARSYRELVSAGIIESRRGVGYIVSERRPVFSEAERSRRLKRVVEPLVQEALVLGIGLAEALRAVEEEFARVTNGKTLKGAEQS